MIGDMERVRHAQEKGTILAALKDDYGASMTSVRALARILDNLAQPMRMEGLQFALVYLADCGYVQIWRAKDLPTFRSDRDMDTRPDSVVFAKLLPKGLQLIDGQIPQDPGVSF